MLQGFFESCVLCTARILFYSLESEDSWGWARVAFSTLADCSLNKAYTHVCF